MPLCERVWKKFLPKQPRFSEEPRRTHFAVDDALLRTRHDDLAHGLATRFCTHVRIEIGKDVVLVLDTSSIPKQIVGETKWVALHFDLADFHDTRKFELTIGLSSVERRLTVDGAEADIVRLHTLYIVRIRLLQRLRERSEVVHERLGDGFGTPFPGIYEEVANERGGRFSHHLVELNGKPIDVLRDPSVDPVLDISGKVANDEPFFSHVLARVEIFGCVLFDLRF